MSANLLYVTANVERFEALNAICANENYALDVCKPETIGDCSAYDLIFCDAGTVESLIGLQKLIPIVAVYASSSTIEMQLALRGAAIDVLSYPFGTVETASRLRCLSRLHMLQDELSNRVSASLQPTRDLPVLIISADKTTNALMEQLAPAFTVECAADDITGLLRAAQGHWACVIVALSEDSREPAPLIRQLRVLDRTRITPILVHAQSADNRCVAALQAGANDIALGNCHPAELVKRIKALALRKTVLDALRADAAAIAPLTDFDHATGLPGPTQLHRSMQVCLERLRSQGKPASLLLIAVDPQEGMPAGEPVPDAVMLALTQVLRRSLRGFDYACRYSADCFAVLMPGADVKGAQAVAERICAEIKSEKVRLKDGRKDGTTASIGMVTLVASGGASSTEDMIAAATHSLAQARAIGAAQIIIRELRRAA